MLPARGTTGSIRTAGLAGMHHWASPDRSLSDQLGQSELLQNRLSGCRAPPCAPGWDWDMLPRGALLPWLPRFILLLARKHRLFTPRRSCRRGPRRAVSADLVMRGGGPAWGTQQPQPAGATAAARKRRRPIFGAAAAAPADPFGAETRGEPCCPVRVGGGQSAVWVQRRPTAALWQGWPIPHTTRRRSLYRVRQQHPKQQK